MDQSQNLDEITRSGSRRRNSPETPSDLQGPEGVELFELTKEIGRKGGSIDVMLGEDAIGSGVSEDRTEEQRNASAPPIRKTIMTEEITGE